MVSMRKDQQYRMTKMMLLQKLTFMDWMESNFDYDDSSTESWMTHGFSIYEGGINQVLNLYANGNPISAFRFADDPDTTFRVAMNCGTKNMVTYATLRAQTRVRTARRVGVHFCYFSIENDINTMQYTSETLEKKILQNTATAFALLLPHKQDGIEFSQQYTVIYSDWEVLLIDDRHTSKGFPRPDDSDFSDEYVGHIENLHN